jgi:transposase-like protein
MEEIIRIIRQADGGQTVREVCREHNVHEVTFHRWKRKYGHCFSRTPSRGVRLVDNAIVYRQTESGPQNAQMLIPPARAKLEGGQPFKNVPFFEIA